jgi:phosphate starvation-inducible PhoH-like protein
LTKAGNWVIINLIPAAATIALSSLPLRHKRYTIKRSQTKRGRTTQAEPPQAARKAKFLQQARDAEVYEQTAPRLTAKNPNQKLALAYLTDKAIVFLTGSAGTGKSLLAAYRASCLLQSKKIDKVYLVRPAVSVGKSIGLIPGDIDEKLAPYFAQTLAHIEKFLGKGAMSYCIESKQIEMKPVEYLRGMSFENCVVIVEESQNLTAEEMEMMMTRLGDGCQMIFTGDTRQNDLRGASGLKHTVDLINKILDEEPDYMDDEDLDELEKGIGVVKFTPDDVVRSGLTKAFVKVYFHN